MGSHLTNEKNLQISKRSATNNANSISRNFVRKEFINKTSNRTNFNQSQQNNSVYYSKINQSFKKDLSNDNNNKNNEIYEENNNEQVYSNKKDRAYSNLKNVSYSNAGTSRINSILSSSIPKNTEVPTTNFLSYKILCQNSDKKNCKVEVTNHFSNSFNIPIKYPSNNSNNSPLVSQHKKKSYNHQLYKNLNSSNGNESFNKSKPNEFNKDNFSNYRKYDFKSKIHSDDLSKSKS